MSNEQVAMSNERKQSKLDELIQELCPDGVELYKFDDVCQFIRGITYNKSQEAKTASNTDVAVFRANNITLNSNTLNYDDVKMVVGAVKVKDTQWLRKGDILMCAGSGSKDHIGKVAFIENDMKYTFGGFMGVVRCDIKEQQILPMPFPSGAAGFFSPPVTKRRPRPPISCKAPEQSERRWAKT